MQDIDNAVLRFRRAKAPNLCYSYKQGLLSPVISKQIDVRKYKSKCKQGCN